VNDSIQQIANQLEEEFAGLLPAGTSARLVHESFDTLVENATVTAWLPILVKRFARERLYALAKSEQLLTDTRPAVLFLCVHNAGRSQMAAGWLRHLSGDAVSVFSGGSEPASEVNPVAVQAMREVGIDIREEFPKPWTDEVVRAVDVVVSMGCGDACPILPGKRYVDWDLTDPAGQPIRVVREVRDEIAERVRGLLGQLGVPVRTTVGSEE
jgi:arsenate reductase